MLRKALKGAAVAGSAAILAAGAASPAMADDFEYNYNSDDFGGVNVLSNICLNVSDLIDILAITDSEHCTATEVDNNETNIDVDDIDVDVDGKHHHGKHHGKWHG